MKRIFISSKLNKLALALAPEIPPQFNQYLSPVFNENKFISSLSENGQFQIGTNLTSKVILINDELTNLGNITINQDDDYLLYHNTTKETITTLFKYKVKGHNMPNDESLYRPVLKIIFDGRNEKAERIIEFLFPPAEKILDVKLNLLHLCLTPESAKNAREVTDYYLIKEEVERCNMPIDSNLLVIDHLAIQNPSDCFDEEKYIKPLSLLRDKLLGY